MESKTPPKEPVNWVTNYPRLKSKNDLRAQPLKILNDRPPEPSSKKGMFSLLAMNAKTSETYTILVTAQDLDRIIGVITDPNTENPRLFTFDDKQPWAEVIPYVETLV
jgi:hypothetical protein